MSVNRKHRGQLLSAAVVAAMIGLVAPPTLAAAAPTGPKVPLAHPLPAAVGDLPWMNKSLSPQQRADLLLKAMTLDQKIEQIANKPEPEKISGTYLAEGGKQATCKFTDLARHVEGIPSLGIPDLREVNGGNGIRGGNCADEPVKTGGPSMTLAAASFDPQATYGWGEVVGAEAKTFAHQILLGPAMNLIRNPYAGRAQEYPGEDPYLAGMIGSAQIDGIQSQGTQVMMKHFVGNDNEFDNERWTSAMQIPSRAMHELYLLPFEMAVKNTKVAAVMCAYPMVNYSWDCDSSSLLQKTLRDRWGFKGWIESDRAAMHSTVKAVDAGVGYELDWLPKYYAPQQIKDAIGQGQIREANLDAVLRPRYEQMFAFGNFDQQESAFGKDDLTANAAKARVLATEGITLLKNDNKFLPLSKNIKQVKSIALIGPQWFAGQAVLPPRSTNPTKDDAVVAPYTVTPLQGIKDELTRLGSTATVTFNDATDVNSAVDLAKKSDVVIMMLGTTPREMHDLASTNLPVVNGVDQQALAGKVLSANSHTAVVLKTAAGVTMDWAKSAPAIVAAWFPGQDDGDVVAGVLFGRINPSGKSPVTWPKTDHEAAFATTEQYPGVHKDTGVWGGKGRVPTPGAQQLVVDYSEGLSMGYRWYQQNNVTPEFAFGHGLSYTTFAYSQLQAFPGRGKTGNTTVTVTFRLTNTGDVAGTETAQMYLTLPSAAGEPSQRLVGFQRVALNPHESKMIKLTLDSAAANHPFSYFQPASTDLANWADGTWNTASGVYTIRVGGASDNLSLARPVALSFR